MALSVSFTMSTKIPISHIWRKGKVWRK